MPTISQLCDRYKIDKNQYHVRKRSLLQKGFKFTTYTENRETCLHDRDATLFDAQDDWLKEGKSLETFQIPRVPEVIESSLPRHNTGENTDNFSLSPQIAIAPDSIEAIASAVAEILKPNKLTWKYDKLRWLARFKIEISTSEARELIDVSPKGDRFYRGSFIFIKVGKMGRQSAWRVQSKSLESATAVA